jgi:SOS-response transcriptional repressor LexA
MTSAGINDGDLLIFEVGDTLEDGDIGMFFFGKEHKSVCRIYKTYQSGAIYLLGDLKREPIRVDHDENFRIGGKLVGICKAV